jgi:6,7-dimethyl-8-ribityllumazine synthase
MAMNSSIIKGDFSGKGRTIGVIISRFNDFITSKLLAGALDVFDRVGVSESDIDIYQVPGAFEIPGVLNKLVQSNRFDGILTLGAVIRGSTPHFEFVASESAKGIASISRDADIPVVYSVLTTDTIEQAIERAGTKSGNKGADGAMNLIELINLYKVLPKRTS